MWKVWFYCFKISKRAGGFVLLCFGIIVFEEIGLLFLGLEVDLEDI